MTDYSEIVLDIKNLTKTYLNAASLNKDKSAYDISISLVDVCQKLEDLSKARLDGR